MGGQSANLVLPAQESADAAFFRIQTASTEPALLGRPNTASAAHCSTPSAIWTRSRALRGSSRSDAIFASYVQAEISTQGQLAEMLRVPERKFVQLTRMVTASETIRFDDMPDFMRKSVA